MTRKISKSSHLGSKCLTFCIIAAETDSFPHTVFLMSVSDLRVCSAQVRPDCRLRADGGSAVWSHLLQTHQNPDRGPWGLREQHKVCLSCLKSSRDGIKKKKEKKRKQAHPASTSRTGPRIKDSGWQHDALNHLLNMPDEAREQTWSAEANKKLLDFRFMSVEDVKCSTDWLTDCALQVFGQSFVCHLLWRHHDCIMGSAQAELKGLLVARPRQLGEEHRVRHQHSAPRHVWLRRQRHHVGH